MKFSLSREALLKPLQLVVGVVEEFNLVSNVHTNGVTNEGLAGLNLELKQIGVSDGISYVRRPLQ